VSLSTSAPPTRVRLRAGLRYLVLTGVLVGVTGVAGTLLTWPLLTTAIGPTAYMLVAHPGSVTSQLRNAVLGHAVAIVVGLGSLAAFGLWSHPSVSADRHPVPAQVAASALAVGLTLLLLELADLHHAPAATSVLLVTTGLAKPGLPLLGLVVGLAIVLAVAPPLARLPLAREDAERAA